MLASVDAKVEKTIVILKNIYDRYPMTRSQAKRLCNRFDRFEEVELDFKEVESIGQGFAHEIFVVFQIAHPGVRIIPTNMSEKVEKMIYHVKNLK